MPQDPSAHWPDDAYFRPWRAGSLGTTSCFPTARKLGRTITHPKADNKSTAVSRTAAAVRGSSPGGGRTLSGHSTVAVRAASWHNGAVQQ
jgi:hypothetical protein